MTNLFAFSPCFLSLQDVKDTLGGDWSDGTISDDDIEKYITISEILVRYRLRCVNSQEDLSECSNIDIRIQQAAVLTVEGLYNCDNKVGPVVANTNVNELPAGSVIEEKICDYEIKYHAGGSASTESEDNIVNNCLSCMPCEATILLDQFGTYGIRRNVCPTECCSEAYKCPCPSNYRG